MEDILKELGFESKEQLTQAIEKAKLVDTLEQEKNTFAQQVETLAKEKEDYATRLNTYEGNEFIKTLATIEPEKVDTFLQLRKVDENISGLDAYKLRLKLEKGFSDADIADEIEVQLTKLGISDYDVADEEEKKKYDARINRNFSENKQWLLEQKKKLSTPVNKVDPKIEDQEINKIASEFVNPFSAEETFATFDVTEADFTEETLVEAGLDKDIPLNFKTSIPFDEELKAMTEKLTKELIVKGKYKNPKENLQEIKQYVSLLAKGAMYDKHLAQTKKEVIFEAAKRNKEYYAKKYSVATERKPYAGTETKKFGNQNAAPKGGFVSPLD